VTAWRDPFEFPDAAGWRHGRNLSHLIFHNFKKTQATPRLPAPFFLSTVFRSIFCPISEDSAERCRRKSGFSTLLALSCRIFLKKAKKF